MPNPRSLTKEKHERFQVGLLIDQLNYRHRSTFKVVDEPDPPEAIIQSGQTTRWVEVVTAYWTEAYARNLNSYATPGETHVPVGNGPYMDMDEIFASNFVTAVQSKVEKQGYAPFQNKYGPGYLVVSIQHPFLDAQSFHCIREEWLRREIHDLGCFRSIYVTFRSTKGYRVIRWTPG